MQQTETVEESKSVFGNVFLVLIVGTVVSLFGSALIPNVVLARALTQVFGAFFVGLILYIIFKNAKIEIKS
jgi:hypothetical protein